MDQPHFVTCRRLSSDQQTMDISPVDQIKRILTRVKTRNTVDMLAHPFYDAWTVAARVALVSTGV